MIIESTNVDLAQKPQLNIPAVSCSVVHCKKAPYDVYIGRPSKWGNPFTHIKDGKTLAKFVVGSRFFKNSGVKITSKHHKKSKKMFCFQ